MKFTPSLDLSEVAGLHRARASLRLRGLLRPLVAVMVAGLVGCSVAPKLEEVKPLAPVAEPIGDSLARAQAVEVGEGGREQARQIYREAAKAYPADKRPWLRLAQSFFDARDYGNAVLAAEEVVQRDASDTTAQSLLVVSGLRISTAALSTLRNPTYMNSSTRQEAEGMAQSLRSILGEPVLVPRSVEAEAPRPKTGAKPQIRPRAVAGSIAPAAAVNPKAAAPSNPFGALN